MDDQRADLYAWGWTLPHGLDGAALDAWIATTHAACVDGLDEWFVLLASLPLPVVRPEIKPRRPRPASTAEQRAKNAARVRAWTARNHEESKRRKRESWANRSPEQIERDREAQRRRRLPVTPLAAAAGRALRPSPFFLCEMGRELR